MQYYSYFIDEGPGFFSIIYCKISDISLVTLGFKMSVGFPNQMWVSHRIHILCLTFYYKCDT